MIEIKEKNQASSSTSTSSHTEPTEHGPASLDLCSPMYKRRLSG